MGASFFIPAINARELKLAVRRAARERGVKKLEAVTCIENGLLGVRFWRIV